MTCERHYAITQDSVPALNILSALFIHPSLLPNPWQPRTFLPSSECLPECHVVGILPSVAFPNGLTSFGNVHVGFLRGLSWFDSSFLFIAEWCFIVWMDHSLFINAPVEGQLSFFQALAIMNKAVLSIYVQVFVWT